MMQPFIDRNPITRELEKFRLIFSTYQDGSGMLVCEDGGTLPGWRDFERTVAAAFDGVALESKAIYDVLLPAGNSGLFYGISCKMRETLSQVNRDGRVTIEVSNASGEFWDLLLELGIHQQNLQDYSERAGRAILERVERWHTRVDHRNGGKVITESSFYLALQYSLRTGLYQLFQFPILFPDPSEISWYVDGRRLVGLMDESVIIEWYGKSGGQLKYYPNQERALWRSPRFELEPLPKDIEAGLVRKAAAYYPQLWRTT